MKRQRHRKTRKRHQRRLSSRQKRTAAGNMPAVQSEFIDRLQHEMERRSYTQAQIAKALHVRREQVNRWLNGSVMPRFSQHLQLDTLADGMFPLAKPSRTRKRTA